MPGSTVVLCLTAEQYEGSVHVCGYAYKRIGRHRAWWFHTDGRDPKERFRWPAWIEYAHDVDSLRLIVPDSDREPLMQWLKAAA